MENTFEKELGLFMEALIEFARCHKQAETPYGYVSHTDAQQARDVVVKMHASVLEKLYSSKPIFISHQTPEKF